MQNPVRRVHLRFADRLSCNTRRDDTAMMPVSAAFLPYCSWPYFPLQPILLCTWSGQLAHIWSCPTGGSVDWHQRTHSLPTSATSHLAIKFPVMLTWAMCNFCKHLSWSLHMKWSQVLRILSHAEWHAVLQSDNELCLPEGLCLSLLCFGVSKFDEDITQAAWLIYQRAIQG